MKSKKAQPATSIAAKKVNTESPKENLFPEVLPVLLKKLPPLRRPKRIEGCMVQDRQTPAVRMVSDYGLVSTRTSVTLRDDCLSQQHWTLHDILMKELRTESNLVSSILFL